jgi:peptidyl-prolyl cis-trans isomerase B (cyclophilin B)
LTSTNKSVGKVYNSVVASWDSIKFMKTDGSRIHYSATVETDLGSLEITLDADAAPNHVRSFIALARAGYYDGLTFDRVHHEEVISDTGSAYEEISAGCPLGIGNPSTANVGYWLRPEFNTRLTHDAGTVGACRAMEEDTAACKFYISLSKAPYLNGNFTAFGTVTRGLDVARKIYVRPVVLEDTDADGSRRPLQPVVIRKVTIQERTTSN